MQWLRMRLFLQVGVDVQVVAVDVLPRSKTLDLHAVAVHVFVLF